MKKKFLILIFILNSLNSFCSKRDTSIITNSFAINLESLLIGDLKLTYTHRLCNSLFLETMLSYNIPLSESYILSARPGWYLKDPYSYYGRFQIREGLKIYTTKTFYLCPEFLYSYGSFIQHEDVIYRPNDVWYIASRYKNDFELFLKLGWTFHRKNFLQDLYFGMGWRIKLLDDVIYASTDDRWFYGYQNGIPPYDKKTSYGMFTFHLGYQIGICTKKHF